MVSSTLAPTRRGLLRGGAVLGGAALATGLATGSAEASTRPRRSVRRPVWERVHTTHVDPAFGLHLLRRTTYGVTPALQADLAKAGSANAWLEQQLAPASIPDAQCDAVLARFPLAVADPPTIQAASSFGDWTAMQQLGQATLARATWSKRQLFEVMVEFWSNHLNITTPSSDVWSGKPWDDVHVVRAHALGRFDDMLVASATSPAMLNFLNVAQSQGSAPNENYGRELLELHTVGVDTGYTHDDIVNAARVMTGNTVWDPWNGGVASNLGTLRYRPDWHYVGPVSLLGWSHPNSTAAGGPAVAESMLRHLAAMPQTAARIAGKLAVRFVSDSPSAALVQRLAQVYLDNGTAIVPVLRALFASPEFAASAGQKQRRPYDRFVSVARTLGVTPTPDASTDLGTFTWLCRELGQEPLAWPAPNGYPDVLAAWTGPGTVLGAWNVNVGLVSGWWSDGAFTYQKDLPTYLLGATKPTTRGALVDALLARLVPGTVVRPSDRAALIGFLGADGPLANGDLSWLFPPLVALVLDMPQAGAR